MKRPPVNRRSLRLHPVTRWYPAKGSAFVGPTVRVFCASKIRANLGWWKPQQAPRSILRALKHGVKLERESVLFIGTEFSILYTSMHSPA